MIRRPPQSVSPFKIIVVFLLFIGTGANAASEKSGIITRPEYWTLDNSPYTITDDLLIAPGGRVTIEPGVTIFIEQPRSYIQGIEQHDNNDSFMVAITVLGGLKCVGKSDSRISFITKKNRTSVCSWYGIVSDPQRKELIEVAYTDLPSACTGMTILQGRCLIRNVLFEFNNVGVLCRGFSQPSIVNSIFAYNTSAAIMIEKANPEILNSIIIHSANVGIWSDRTSAITVAYNCFYNNLTDFSGCDPFIGLQEEKKKEKKEYQKIFHDRFFNIFADPVFAGTTADSQATEFDLTIPTDRSRVKDTTISRIINDTLIDSSAHRVTAKSRNVQVEKKMRYMLSRYSPCIDRGSPQKKFRDTDGSRNDMGIHGGQEIFDISQ